ncbi:MAG: CaiB/BaiF CoA transferase family protein [Candidatus Binatia bacterium]
MDYPLNGVSVLDLTHELSGPFCTMLLGDLGAIVTKIERPVRGDGTRRWGTLLDAAFIALNRNKRSVTVNLADPSGREIIYRLARRSDVLVENFSPGTMEKLGLDYGNISRIKRDIIYCSIRGFSSDGPYGSRPAWDPVVQAMSGIMSITGDPEGSPVRAGPSIVDITTGIYAAFAIVSSLYEKTQKGGGKLIEVPMLASALSLVADRIVLYSLTGALPQRLGSGHPAFEPYRVFKTGDGYIFIGCSNDAYWEAFCRALDLMALRDDPRFRTNDLRLKNRVELKTLLEQTMANYSTEEILDRIEETGIPHSPVNTFDRLIEDPHVQACGLIRDFIHDDGRETKQLPSPIKLGGQRIEIQRQAPPLGQETEETLIGLGYTRQDIQRLKDLKAI